MTKMTRVAPDGLSLKEVADRFGVHEDTVRRWLKKGQILGGRVGPKLLRIPVTEVRRVMQLRQAL